MNPFALIVGKIPEVKLVSKRGRMISLYKNAFHRKSESSKSLYRSTGNARLSPYTHSQSAAAPPFILFPIHPSISPDITHPLIEVPGLPLGANKRAFGPGINPITIQRQSLSLPFTYYVISPWLFFCNHH